METLLIYSWKRGVFPKVVFYFIINWNSALVTPPDHHLNPTLLPPLASQSPTLLSCLQWLDAERLPLEGKVGVGLGHYSPYLSWCTLALAHFDLAGSIRPGYTVPGLSAPSPQVQISSLAGSRPLSAPGPTLWALGLHPSLCCLTTVSFYKWQCLGSGVLLHTFLSGLLYPYSHNWSPVLNTNQKHECPLSKQKAPLLWGLTLASRSTDRKAQST